MSNPSAEETLEEIQPVDHESREDEPINVLNSAEGGTPSGSASSVVVTERSYESSLIIITFNDKYLRSLPGFLKFLQIVCSVIALICVTSSGTSSAFSYLLLPLAWHLRVYVFITVFALLISIITLILNLTNLGQMLPVNWNLFDLIVYSVLAFGFLFGASLVASAVDFYQNLDHHVSRWSIEQLIISVVLGYFGVFLFGATAFIAYRKQQGSSQFGPRKFSESQVSTSAT